MAKNTKHLGIGIVGAGFMCKAHSNAYSAMKYMYAGEGFSPQLVAVGADTAQEAAAAAERYGYRKSCAGWADIVSDPEVDIVDICLSDALHKRVCLDAIQAGKNVICEKPLALNPDDALEMFLAAEEAKVRHLTGFNYRFIPAVRLARDLIASDVIGKPYRFSGSYAQDPGADPGTSAEKVWYAAGPKSSGAAKGIGSHLIDMARFLMGEIVTVDGKLKTYNRSRPSASGPLTISQDEAMSALVDFEGGADGILGASAVAAGRKNRIAWEINGTKGSLSFDMEELNFLNVYLMESQNKAVTGFTRIDVTQADRGHPFAERWWPKGHGIGWEHAHVNELAHFLSCVASGEPVEPQGASFRDGYRATAVIEAIAQSSASGRRVDLEYLDGPRREPKAASISALESKEESR
jgi:predicted dehydrogenase